MNSLLRPNLLFLQAVTLMLLGCNGDVSVRPNQVISEDLNTIYSDQNLISLSLDQAIERALAYNLDAKIAEKDFLLTLSDAELQKLNSLPTITAQHDFITRSNDGASSSVSAETGVESLEPSISTDRSRFTSMLEANWNVVDAAINIYRSKSAVDRSVIAQERLRRVRQNVVGDVTLAFLRAAMAQEARASLKAVMAHSEEMLEALAEIETSGDLPFEDLSAMQTEILSKRRELKDRFQPLELANLELRALLSLRPQQGLRLITKDQWLSKKELPQYNKDVDYYVDQALENRPELREEIINLRIAKRELKATIYDTFPGLNFLLTGNIDNNSFLQDNEFATFTATLSQSITRILTLPARYQRAENDIDLANARRQALIAAIISQVHIGKALLERSYENYIEHMRMYDVAKNKNMRAQKLRSQGLLGGLKVVREVLDFEIAKLARFENFIQFYEAGNRLTSAIGLDYSASSKGLSERETKNTGLYQL